MNCKESGVLDDRTVIITGAGSCIGRTPALLAAAARAYVVAAGINNQDTTTTVILDAGGRAGRGANTPKHRCSGDITAVPVIDGCRPTARHPEGVVVKPDIRPGHPVT